MASAPSRYEVEQLHRSMMQASVEAAQLDKRLQEEQKSDGLSGELKQWHDAADALLGAVGRARAGLLAAGTPEAHLDRIEGRLADIKMRAKNFDLDNDLEGCVSHWKSLGLEFAQLAGKHRDALAGLLESRKGRIDQTTALLSQAKQSEGLAPEKHRKVLRLAGERDRARERYERLRQKYLEAERDCQIAEQQKATEKSAAQEHKAGSAPVPNLAALAKKGPVLVRLPVAEKKPVSAEAKKPKAEAVKPLAVKKLALARQLEKKQEPKKEAAKPAAPGKNLAVQKPKTSLARPAATLAPKKSLSEAQQAALHKPAAAKAGPPQIALERVEKVAGYVTGMDGIGRGAQTANIYFRADHLGESPQVQGAAAVQLGCAVRLDVLPSVQIFSAAAGAPLRGKLSLGLFSSGGRLGTMPSRKALDSAKQAASQAASAVAGKLDFLGKQLQPAIKDVLEDAAAKIFSRAQARAAPNQLPVHRAGAPQKAPSVEFQVARFNHALGSIIIEARSVQGGQTQKHKLGALLDRDHRQRASVAGRLEQTLQHLATATHRTLTDASAGELRTNLARMDSVLARLKGKAGQEVAEGAQEISGLLQRMGSIASSKGGAPYVAEYKKLIDERRGQLKKIVGEADKPGKAPRHPLPSTQASVVRQLNELRKHNPGLDKLLKNASQSQLAAELAKVQTSGLHKLPAKGAKPGGLGSYSLAGSFQSLGGAHLGGFGGGSRGALAGLTGAGGALGMALEKQLDAELRRAQPGDIGKILAGFQKAPRGTALHDLAKKADEKQKRIATRAQRGPLPAHITAQALLEVFNEHPKGKNFAQHLAPGGALRHLCEAAQRGHGLPIGKMAQHYLASRGSSQIWNAVQTFNSLVKEGHKPHFWSFSSIAKAAGGMVSGALKSVTNTVSNTTNKAQGFASAALSTAGVGRGASSFGGNLLNMGKSALSNVAARAVGGVKGYVSDQFAQAKQFGGSISQKARALADASKGMGKQAWGGIQKQGSGLWDLAKSGKNILQGASGWAQHKVGDVYGKARDMRAGAIDWAKHRADTAAQWAKGTVHSGLEWAKKTGVAGGLNGLKGGMSLLKNAAGYTPLGLAYKAAMKTGDWAKHGGFSKLAGGARNLAGKAWGGLKAAGKTTGDFLQSPQGQLLVTGLSLAATFIPGGLVVKTLIGAGIGAITAISEGKDWKGVLAGAAGGAITGALPFLKIGPLAKIGIGALQGGISTLASGGNFNDALKGAAGGTLDSFGPGSFGALKKMKGFATAEKLLGGKKLSKAEEAFLKENKYAGPLRGLEKAMQNPKLRKSMGGLEKVGGKAIKGGIWLSGKAAKAQGVLDQLVGAGDKIEGVLSEVHDLAPGLSNLLGDNAAGHFVGQVGDLAGKGDEKLSKALEYGHAASDKLSQYKGYLDKGLGAAGVKHPQKAYEKMMARKDLRAGKKGSLEQVGKQKLEDHKRKHPELHLAEATGKRTRGKHDEAPSSRKRVAAPAAGADVKHETPEKGARKTSPHDVHAQQTGKAAGKTTSHKTATELERALAKGKHLIKRGQKVAQGVHDGLGKVHSVVAKGLKGAEQVQSDLEKASALAQMGAGILGEDTELGKYLLDVSAKADKVHSFLAQGISLADEFDKNVGKVHDGMEDIPGVHAGGKHPGHQKKSASPLEEATHLEGKGKPKGHEAKKSPHDAAPTHGPALKPGAAETDAQKSERYKRARDKIDYISRAVQKFQTDYGKAQTKIQQALAKGQGNVASIELMGLGSQCDEVNKAIAEAKTLAKGHAAYEKELAFYEDWQKKTKAKLHAAIADTKGLGNQTAISAVGLSEASHPDIFANTKNIYSVQTKVTSFGEALHDSDAHEQVKKVLVEAKAAKADLQRLKDKYKGDKAAIRFLTGGGEQDRLIDDSIKKLEAALKGEAPQGKKPAALYKRDASKVKPDAKKKKPEELVKTVQHGLRAIDRYKKKALRTGKKVDAGLTHVERELSHGIKVGKKVDARLASIAGLADHVAKELGEDSPLGHLAEQVGQTAHGGHDKLHEALQMASKGKSALHKGHKLFHQAMAGAADHHGKKLEKVHGKKPAGAEHAHGGAPHAELLKHAAASDKHKPSPHGDALPPELSHLVKGGRRIVHDVHGAERDATKMWKDAQHAWGDVKHAGKDVQHAFGDAKGVWGDITSGNWKAALKDGKGLVGDVKGLVGEGKGLFGLGKKIFGEGKGLIGDAKGILGGVMGLFGGGGEKPSPHDVSPGGKPRRTTSHKAQTSGPAVTPQPPPKDLSEADVANLVQSALQSVTSFGKEVAGAVKEVGALMQAGQTKEAGAKVQSLSLLSEHTRSEVRHAVSSSAKFAKLSVQAQAASKHYLEIRGQFFQFVKGLHGLAGKAQEVDAKGHAEKGAAKKGDKDPGVKGKGGKKPGKPEAGSKPSKSKGQADDLGGILGDDHRIHVDRGGARGDMNVHDGQEIDTAASDTWIGSGEGIKLFSEVFGAFIPAEGAAVLVAHQAGGGGSRKKHGGGAHAGPGGGGAGAGSPEAGGGGINLPGGSPDLSGGGGLPGIPGLGDEGGGPGGILGQVGKLVPGKVTGFFKGLFDHLGGFADKIGGWAKFGAGMIGKGMHFAEMGMHGLKMIEGAAGKLEGFAGKAEGFLDKMGLHKLAGFAGKIGGAAGWVDKEANLLHGGLKTADKWMGKGKSVAGQVEGGAKQAGGIFDKAAQGKFGDLVNLFKASKNGESTDGKLVPEKMSLSSMLDEPRRLDITTLSRMEMFLGGSFAGVRIHTGPGAAHVTGRFNAEAVTVKDHIFFAPGRFNPSTAEGQRLLAHELTHVLQKGRPNLDVRTAETEALHSEHSYGTSPDMTTLNLRQPEPDFKLGDGMGLGNASGVHTAKRNRSKGHEAGGKDTLPDGEEFIEQISGRVYELLMEELEHSFESR